MSEDWYLYKNEVQQGPYSWTQLYQEAQSGRILPDDLVWNQNLQNWIPASQVPGLIPQAGKAAPIVRIAWNEMPRFKRALDLGAKGIMIPYVQNAKEARMAVDSMRYSPEGSRGVASSPRSAGFGREFEKYYAEANRSLLTVVQIETGDALNNLESIATVDGVDVLFVGPLDLSVSLNMPGRFDDLAFRGVLSKVAEAAKAADKAAGILLPGSDLIELVHSLGFTFVAAGADGGMVVNGFTRSFEELSRYK